MAKQTFTTGQVLTAAQMQSLQQTAMGGGSPSTKTASYVLTAADAGTVIQMNSASATTITVNTSLFAAGDSVQIQNIGAGVCTITAGTATVNSAGTLGVTQYDGGFLYFNSASSAIWFDYTQAGTALPLTTKGDLFGYSTTNARVPVGADATVLTADSTEALGVKWAAPAAGGGITLLSTTTLSGTKTTVSSISQDYKNLYVIIDGITWDTANGLPTCNPNDSTSGIYYNGVENSTALGRSNQRFYLSGNYNILRTGGNNYYVLTFKDYTSTTKWKGIQLYGSHTLYDSTATSLNYAGAWRNTTAISSLAVAAEGFDMTAGTIRIFGEK